MRNKIPKHWQVKKLGEICEIFTGNSINASIKERDFTNLRDGLNYIATKDIGFDGEINYENGIKIPFSKISKFKVAKSDSVLLCIEGGSAGKKLAFLKQDVCFVNKLCCLKFKGKNNSKILYYLLQSNDFLSKFYFNVSGLIGGITKTALKEIYIPLPPSDEQNLIVKKIERCFEKIDFAISNFKKSKELIEIYKQSVLSHAFNGKLTNSNLNSWQVKKLGEICEIISKGTTPKGGNNAYKTNGVIFLRAENILFGSIDFESVKFIDLNLHQKDLKRSILKNGDLLITIAGVLGRCAILNSNLEINTNQAVCFARLKEEYKTGVKFIQRFISFNQTQQRLLRQAKTTAIPNLTLEIIRNLEIPLPPLSEQKLIISEIEKRFKAADSALNLIEQNLKKAEILKQSILSKAFNGRLVKDKK